MLTSTDVLCNLDTNGTAKVDVYGGVGPFAFNWSSTPTGQGTDSIYNLSPGFYWDYATSQRIKLILLVFEKINNSV